MTIRAIPLALQFRLQSVSETLIAIPLAVGKLNLYIFFSKVRSAIPLAVGKLNLYI
jgi:hypothetical protein